MLYRAIDARNGAILYFDCARIISWQAKLTGNNSDAEFTIYLTTEGAPPHMVHFYCPLDDVERINKEILAAFLGPVVDTSHVK